MFCFVIVFLTGLVVSNFMFLRVFCVIVVSTCVNASVCFCFHFPLFVLFYYEWFIYFLFACLVYKRERKKAENWIDGKDLGADEEVKNMIRIDCMIV